MASLVVATGRAIITNRILGSGTEPKYAAWGTGAGTAADSNTTLFTEAAEARVAGTGSQTTTTTTSDTHQVTATIVAGATRAITNAGLFDASTSGNLYLKGDFSTVNLASGDSIAFTFQARFA